MLLFVVMIALKINFEKLTQCEDLRNLYILLPELGEDPSEKVSHMVVDLKH